MAAVPGCAQRQEDEDEEDREDKAGDDESGQVGDDDGDDVDDRRVNGRMRVWMWHKSIRNVQSSKILARTALNDTIIICMI